MVLFSSWLHLSKRFRCLGISPQDAWCGSQHTLKVLARRHQRKSLSVHRLAANECGTLMGTFSEYQSMRLSALSTAAERAGVLCCALFMVISAQALAQTSATDNPGPTAAQPSVAAEEKPAAATEDKPPAAADITATAEPKPAEEKPVIAQDKPAATEEKPAATDDKPAVVEQETAPAEEKPAIAQDKPAAVEEKSAAVSAKPAIVEHTSAIPDAKPAVVERK